MTDTCPKPKRRGRAAARCRPRLMRGLEWLLVYVGGPVMVWLWVPAPSWPWLLGAIALPGLWLSLRRPQAARQQWLGALRPRERRCLARVLTRFALGAALLVAAAGLWLPEPLFQLPLRAPGAWLLLMVSYPLFSVYPQELIYRHLFRRRYRRLFPGRVGWVAASTVAFAGLHLLFENWLAPTLTVVGGVLFAETYRRARSLRLVVLEHSLYGTLVFSVGLGEFFYHGAI